MYHFSRINLQLKRDTLYLQYWTPENVVITDKTRHASVNVTRVYWEHLGRPIFEKSVDKVQDEKLAPYYISMRKPHQGMYLVTPELLRAWKDRGPKCRFNEVRDRPSNPKNPHFPSQERPLVLFIM